MAKFYTVKETIDGVEYTAQFNGISNALRAIDSTYIEGTNVTSVEKIAQYVLENVIVDPKGLKVDDFDDIDTFNKVSNFAQQVMQGKIKPNDKEKK